MSQINDAIVEFYYNITPDHQYNDTLFEALGDLGFEGALQDRMFTWLGAATPPYEGTLTDKLYAWAADQNGTPDRNAQINDQLLEYYDRQPIEGELVTYTAGGNAMPVYYSDKADLVTYAEA